MRASVMLPHISPGVPEGDILCNVWMFASVHACEGGCVCILISNFAAGPAFCPTNRFLSPRAHLPSLCKTATGALLLLRRGVVILWQEGKGFIGEHFFPDSTRGVGHLDGSWGQFFLPLLVLQGLYRPPCQKILGVARTLLAVLSVLKC